MIVCELILVKNVVNPFTYTIFFITEEPEDDTDPDPLVLQQE
jgi:hypothetical protein